MNDQKLEDIGAVVLGTVFALLVFLASVAIYKHFHLHH
jgi:hypothetical protein